MTNHQPHRARPILRGALAFVGLLAAPTLAVAMAESPGPIQARTPGQGRPEVFPTVVPDRQTESRRPGRPQCADGYTPSCGPFRFTEAPRQNSALTVSAKLETPAPRVGAPVNISVVGIDPDQAIDRNCVLIQYGDSLVEPYSCEVPVCLPQYGDWVPPIRDPDRFERTISHVFDRAGTYEITVSLRSKVDTCGHPYESVGETALRVTVL